MGLRPHRLAGSTALLQVAVQSCSQLSGQGGRHGNVLLIKHSSLSWPEAGTMAGDQNSFGLALHMSLGRGTERYSGLLGHSSELPFVDAVFRRVLLWHVIAAGREPELAEACRVLQPGGELLVLGLNQMAIGARFDQTITTLPRLHRQSLEEHLSELEMEVTGAWGSGMAGVASPVFWHNGWSGLLLPFADQLVLRVQHAEPVGLSPLPMARFQAGIAPSA